MSTVLESSAVDTYPGASNPDHQASIFFSRNVSLVSNSWAEHEQRERSRRPSARKRMHAVGDHREHIKQLSCRKYAMSFCHG